MGSRTPLLVQIPAAAGDTGARPPRQGTACQSLTPTTLSRGGRASRSAISLRPAFRTLIAAPSRRCHLRRGADLPGRTPVHVEARFGYCPTLIEGAKFAADSPLEGTGFEPSVPLLRKALLGVANRRRRHERRSHLQVQVRNGNACLEWLPIAFPFAEGPRVRIRLPPPKSHELSVPER